MKTSASDVYCSQAELIGCILSIGEVTHMCIAYAHILTDYLSLSLFLFLFLWFYMILIAAKCADAFCASVCKAFSMPNVQAHEPGDI